MDPSKGQARDSGAMGEWFGGPEGARGLRQITGLIVPPQKKKLGEKKKKSAALRDASDLRSGYMLEFHGRKGGAEASWDRVRTAPETQFPAASDALETLKLKKWFENHQEKSFTVDLGRRRGKRKGLD